MCDFFCIFVLVIRCVQCVVLVEESTWHWAT